MNSDLETANSLPSPKQFLNNTKIMRSLCINDMTVSAESERYTVSIGKFESFFDIQADSNLSSSKNLTIFDRDVMDAVYTLAKNDIDIFTVEKIATTLSGNRAQRISESRREMITNSLEKLRRITIRIDCTEEFRARNNDKDESSIYVFESYLLPLESISRVTRSGKAASAYHLICTPALYEYAAQVHQIIDIPEVLLQTQGYYNDTDDAVMIKRYVIRRVMQILNGKNSLTNNKISFEWQDGSLVKGLYYDLGYTPDGSTKWRTKIKPMVLKIVRQTLQHLKNLGVISDFSPYRSHWSNNPIHPIMGFCITPCA